MKNVSTVQKQKAQIVVATQSLAAKEQSINMYSSTHVYKSEKFMNLNDLYMMLLVSIGR